MAAPLQDPQLKTPVFVRADRLLARTRVAPCRAVHGVVVAHGGKLMLERYFEGEDRRAAGRSAGSFSGVCRCVGVSC